MIPRLVAYVEENLAVVLVAQSVLVPDHGAAIGTETTAAPMAQRRTDKAGGAILHLTVTGQWVWARPLNGRDQKGLD